MRMTEYARLHPEVSTLDVSMASPHEVGQAIDAAEWHDRTTVICMRADLRPSAVLVPFGQSVKMKESLQSASAASPFSLREEDLTYTEIRTGIKDWTVSLVHNPTGLSELRTSIGTEWKSMLQAKVDAVEKLTERVRGHQQG